jgi:hypothetical protein
MRGDGSDVDDVTVFLLFRLREHCGASRRSVSHRRDGFREDRNDKS